MVESFKLDRVDRIILYELDLNARTSNKKIAKIAQVSEQLVNYRIKRILENNYVRYFYTIINLGRLDYENFRIYIRLQDLKPEKEAELVSYLKENPFVVWIAKCRGHWDLVVSFWAKNSTHFSGIYKELIKRFDNIILTKNISIIEKADHFTRAYILKGNNAKDTYIYGGVKEATNTDELDGKIMAVMARNARLSFLELSKRLEVSPDTIIKRVKRLEDRKIILGYRTLLNLPKIGFSNNILILKLHYLDSKRISEFLAFTKEHSNIIFVMHCLGNHDIDLEVEVESQARLDEFITELRKKFSDIIRDMETLTVCEESKFTYYPMEKTTKISPSQSGD